MGLRGVFSVFINTINGSLFNMSWWVILFSCWPVAFHHTLIPGSS